MTNSSDWLDRLNFTWDPGAKAASDELDRRFRETFVPNFGDYISFLEAVVPSDLPAPRHISPTADMVFTL